MLPWLEAFASGSNSVTWPPGLPVSSHFLLISFLSEALRCPQRFQDPVSFYTLCSDMKRRWSVLWSLAFCFSVSTFTCWCPSCSAIPFPFLWLGVFLSYTSFPGILCLWPLSLCPSPASAHWVLSGRACAGPSGWGCRTSLNPWFFSSQTRARCVTKWPRNPWTRQWQVAVRWHCSVLMTPST